MMTWVDCIDASQKNVSMPDGLWYRKKIFFNLCDLYNLYFKQKNKLFYGCFEIWLLRRLGIISELESVLFQTKAISQPF